jgi:hypothetical protein
MHPLDAARCIESIPAWSVGESQGKKLTTIFGGGFGISKRQSLGNRAVQSKGEHNGQREAVQKGRRDVAKYENKQRRDNYAPIRVAAIPT